MAEFKLGRIRFVWKDQWTADTVYYQDDVVVFGGKTYICVIGHTSQSEFFSDFDIVPPKWNLVSDGQVWRGDWRNETDYYVNDIVKYGSSLYIANENHTSAAQTGTETYVVTVQNDPNVLNGVFFIDGVEAPDLQMVRGKTYVWNQDNATNLFTGAGVARHPMVISTTQDGTHNGGSIYTNGVTYWLDGTEVVDAAAYDAGFAAATTREMRITVDNDTPDTIYFFCYQHANMSGTASIEVINVGQTDDAAKWDAYAEGLDWKGDWHEDFVYRVNDFVKYGGSTYVCTEEHQSVALGSGNGLEPDILKWELLNQGLEYKGDYATGIRYKVNDLVRYGAGVWLCTTPYTSTGDFAADGSNWVKFVEGFQYENDWAPSRGYQPGDVVRYGGNQYISTSTNIGLIPTDNTSDWDLFSEGFRLVGDWNEDSANQHYKVGELVRLGGYTYVCIQDHETGQQPPNDTYWKLVNEGFRWRGEWLDDQEYFEGDVVRYGDNSYICTAYHISEGDDYSTETLTQPGGGAEGSRPDLADSGQYWSVIAVGVEQSVLTTTGDLVYYSGSAPTRLPIGKVGQVLQVSEESIPKWEFLQSVEDIYYVAEHGVDAPYPEYGSNIDRPFKTIRYACEQIEKGPKNPNAQYLIELNRSFIQREVTAWIRDQVTNATPGSIWENFTYDTVKCERDVGFVLDRVKHDLGQGGNLKVRAAAQTFLNALADGPYSTAEENNGTGPYGNLATEGEQSVAAYNYMLTLIGNVLANEVPDTIYQNVTDDSTAIIDQFIDETIEAETTALPRITELVGIITTVLASGDTADIPERDVPQTLVKVSTGQHYEVLPIVVPAYCAILGDELRSTQIIAAEATVPVSDTANTVATFDRLKSVVSDIVVGTSVTATSGNNQVQFADWPHAITEQSNTVGSLVDMMKYRIDYNLSRLAGLTSATITDPTGYSSSLENARENLKANKEFLIAETIAYLEEEYPTLRYGKTDTRRDASYILDSLEYDLTYGGNAMAVLTGLAYWDGDDNTQSQIPAAIKTATIAAINYLKTTAQSVAGNTPVASPYQDAVEQVLSGNTGSITEIADNIEDIIDILDNGPDAVGDTTTLVDPTPADGVNTTTALISASSALVAAEDTVIQNMIDDLNAVAWHTDFTVETTGLTTTEFVVYVGKHSLAHTYVSGGTVTKSDDTELAISDFVYNESTGFATVTTATHGLTAGDIVTIEDITVSCTSGGDTSNYVFPSATSTNGSVTKVFYLQNKCIRDVRKLLKAVRFDFMFNSNYQTLKHAHSYLRGTAVEVYTGNQKTITRDAIKNALTTEAVANVGGNATAIARIQSSSDIIDAIIFGATNEGSVCQTQDQNAYYAMLQLERNREFIKSEISAWIADQIANASAGSIWENYTYDSTLCMRDVDLYIDALKYDLMYPGNYSSRYVARYYTNAVTGSREEDMFYLRDATGVRNCTLNGLNGDLTPANAYGTSRPTAGAYCSLDPGFGPDDFTTWIITRSPYVQGVTTFGNAATGQRIDGDLHNGGNDSMVSNDFTQVISDGIGAHILNNGRAELVSVFTYYSHVGYLAETGGRIRATNGNNSYGDFGSVAEGVDAEETPVTAVVDNRTQYNATISNTNIDNDQLLSVEFGHAGNNYTEAEIEVFGPGTDEVLVVDEFRDNGVNYVFVDQDTDPDVPIGGSGYVVASNVAQSGSTTGIFLAATDGALSTAYPGMKIYIIGGAGIGQYAVIDTYDAGSKEVEVVRESDGVAGWDHVVPGTPIVAPNSSSTYQIEPRVILGTPTNSDAGFAMPTSTNWHDVEYIETSAQYTGVSATGGNGSGATFDVTRNGSKYYLEINAAGTGYSRLDTLTIAGTSAGGASTANDITVTITTVNSVTGAIVEFDFDGLAQKGVFLAVGDGTNGAISIDGETWSAETLPTLSAGNWASIASGLIDDGSSTFKQSGVVVVADGATDVAYSTDADTWLNTTLPGAFNGSGENSVEYGQILSNVGRFVVISDADTDVAYSDNGGATWTLQTGALPATGFDEIAYGAGKFVAINSGTTSVAYSTDGVTWTGVAAPATFAAVTDIVWGNGKFVALGGTNGIMYSLDGITWYENALTLPITATEQKLAYGQGTFVISSDNANTLQYSHDGLYWQSYTIGTGLTGGSNAIAFGNPAQEGKFVAIDNGLGAFGVAAKINTPAKGRASVSNEQVFAIRITEPGSGYALAPSITIVDPNNIEDVVLVPQLGKGSLANPTFVNRGTGFTSASAEINGTNSNGFADFPQTGTFIAVRRLTQRPVPGSNVEFGSLPGEFYKLVSTISFLGTEDGSYTGFLQLSPGIDVEDTLPDGDSVEMRIRFSQVRLTGHDFLDVGTGGFTTTNYPNLPLQQPDQDNETVESNGGRVFYTSTDQDGNFRVGDLFTIEQSTGVATLNADAFNIAGLQELSLGEVTLGGNSATVNEFSTDPFFTANSDSVVPTQRAIKAYIESQIGGGGASLVVNSVTAGDIFIGANTITSLSGAPINIKANVVFSGTVLGLPLAYNYFLR